MQITFISNYINHHQIPMSNALYELLEGDYYFIQTEPMEEDRVKMGWGAEVDELPYLLKFYEQEEKCRELLLNSDVVISGGLEDVPYITPRLEKGLFTIRYTERIYKTGQWKMVSPRGLIKKYKDHVRYRKADLYMLCSGGFVADDFRLIGAYPDKMMRWGYFPMNHKYDIEALLNQKAQKDVPLLLWTGRMLDWKHPEYAVQLAKELKDKGYKFNLHMVGAGEQKETVVNMVQDLRLTDVVSFFDFMPPKAVREKMEEADIYLMTSDRNEGWGAVENEAMNSGCVLIASHMVGATPYLVQHGENGLVYKSGSEASLIAETEKVIADAEYRRKLGKKAYETIDRTWNAREAAKRLVEFCRSKDVNAYQSGPCSKEIPVREYKMYKKLTRR